VAGGEDVILIDDTSATVRARREVPRHHGTLPRPRVFARLHATHDARE